MPLPRAASTLAGSKAVDFTSFFSHNERWTANTASQRLHTGEPPTVADAQYPPALSTRVYRRTEALSVRRLLKAYTELSKMRLTVLNVLAAMSAVAVSPLPTSVPVLLATAIGTTLCSASANTLNQIQEVPFDAQMARTRMRPLVRRAISPLHATGFALVTGIAGPAILWTMVNPTVALLGAGNIALYAGAYTWLKRKSIVNTWVGALVGAVPPLMGWSAGGGHLLPSSAHPVEIFLPSFLSSVPLDATLVDNPLAPLALSILLFCWQFPHFMSIAHFQRESYAQGGYRMLSVLSPTKNALVSLRHALLLIPVCSILIPLSGITTWTFAAVSLVPNLIAAEAAWSFWRQVSDKQARRVFQHSLWYLPVMLGLMMICKRGLDWSSWMGSGAEEEVASDPEVSAT